MSPLSHWIHWHLVSLGGQLLFVHTAFTAFGDSKSGSLEKKNLFAQAGHGKICVFDMHRHCMASDGLRISILRDCSVTA